jgi:hypothetical protein
MEFLSDSKLLLHSNPHDNIFIKCAFCAWAGAKFENYQFHMNTHFKIKMFSCAKCNATFYREIDLKSHVASVHETGEYFCEHFKFKTTSSNNLYYHIYNQNPQYKPHPIEI